VTVYIGLLRGVYFRRNRDISSNKRVMAKNRFPKVKVEVTTGRNSLA